MIKRRVGDFEVYARPIKQPVWPRASWLVYCGCFESSGATIDDALHNFAREHARALVDIKRRIEK